MPKRYDRAYFDRWYRGGDAISTRTGVRRKVTLALSIAEYFLRRPVRSVLDVGCGEAAWLPHLRALRPKLAYQGVDTSSYVVRRFGRTRNIIQGSFGELAALGLRERFDLVVCSDVLHYVPDEHIAPGIAELARLCRGLAFVEAFTTDEDIMGDLDGLIQRPPSFYRSALRHAGLTQVGPYAWLAEDEALDLSGLERVR